MPRRSFYFSARGAFLQARIAHCRRKTVLLPFYGLWLVGKRPHTYRYAAAAPFLPPFLTVNLYCTTIYNKSQAKNSFICFFAVNAHQKCRARCCAAGGFSEKCVLSGVLLLTILTKYIIINNWYRLRFYRLFQSFMPCLE